MGTLEIWNDLAVLGFYVFDWVLPGGPYRKLVEPANSVSQELEIKIMAINNLPKFEGSFASQTDVHAW